jgi:acetyl-CoA carboxylase carboxyltransferase component
MPAIDTQLNARSADFQANAAAMKAVVDDLKVQIEKATLGGGDAARAKHTARGKLLPRDRVQSADPGAFWRSSLARWACTRTATATARPAPASGTVM